MRTFIKAGLIALFFLIVFFGFPTQKNVENLYQITKEDPLLYGEIEHGKFNDSIDILVKKEGEFLEGFRNYTNEENNFFDKKNWGLFPTKFLKAFSTSSEQTSEFLKNPGPSAAFRMLKANQTAALEYKSYIEMQLLAISKFTEENLDSANSDIVFLHVSTNLRTVKNDYEIALENSEKVLNDIDDRKKCLLYGKCDIPKLAKQEKIIEISGIKTRQKLIDIDLSSGEKNKKPGVFIASTSCFGQNDNSKPKLLTFYMTEKSGYLKPKLASENYYLDYDAQRDSWPLAEKFLNKGINYGLQPETNDYRCPDLTYLMDLYYEYFNGKPLFGLPHIMEDIANNLDFLILTQKIEKTPADLLYLLTSRTDYSIFLMPYENSVWRIAEQPKYFASEVDLPSSFETYSGLRQKGYSHSEIREFGGSQIKILKEIINEESEKYTPNFQR